MMIRLRPKTEPFERFLGKARERDVAVGARGRVADGRRRDAVDLTLEQAEDLSPSGRPLLRARHALPIDCRQRIRQAVILDPIRAHHHAGPGDR